MVAHPSTILARWCLTSVIRRERVYSSWYGRRWQCNKIWSWNFIFCSAEDLTVLFCRIQRRADWSVMQCRVCRRADWGLLQILAHHFLCIIKSHPPQPNRNPKTEQGIETNLNISDYGSLIFFICTFEVFDGLGAMNMLGQACGFLNRDWKNKFSICQKPTAPSVPRRSPIQVLSWPDDA